MGDRERENSRRETQGLRDRGTDRGGGTDRGRERHTERHREIQGER